MVVRMVGSTVGIMAGPVGAPLDHVGDEGISEGSPRLFSISGSGDDHIQIWRDLFITIIQDVSF